MSQYYISSTKAFHDYVGLCSYFLLREKLNSQSVENPQIESIFIANIFSCWCSVGCSWLQTMSRHEGVSCDSCMKSNFRGRRFKCLICYDYDLCSACFEAGASTPRHAATHPMQCILTRSDTELYFGGESSLGSEHQHSFTCPFCSKMGFTETTLQVMGDYLYITLSLLYALFAGARI